MKHFISLAIILASCIFTSTASAVDVVREGDIIAAKSANYCYVLDLSKIDTVIPVGNYTLLEALTRIINYDLDLQDQHYAICGIDRTMQTVWRVAKNGTSTTRPAKILVENADGIITRKTSKIRLSVGSDCEQNSGYILPSTGGREWRIPVEYPDLVVVCERVEIPVTNTDQ